ncbi:MAG: hypothetical protein ACREOG_20810 [Gemmatimonadaceae bacterium]
MQFRGTTGEESVDQLRDEQTIVAPMRGAKLPFTNARYEMIDPRVQPGS